MESTIKAALQRAIDILKKADKSLSIENPRLEAELLLAHILRTSRSQIVINSDKPISNSAFREFERLIAKKMSGIPTAYLLGNAEFYGREFTVDRSVLIPRPETEELVEWILLSHETRQGSDATANILDLCAGSGCIGITLACEMNVKYLCLTDQSKDALKIAQKNLEIINFSKNTVKIEILRGDLFDEVKKDDFDIIVSNPPYVTADEYEHLDANVKNFEPREALLVSDPDNFNTRLVKGAFEHLHESGRLYLETSPTLIKSLYQIFESTGFIHIETRKDLSGKDRFLRGQKA
jgi:release factor glutamine methyltransferase